MTGQEARDDEREALDIFFAMKDHYFPSGGGKSYRCYCGETVLEDSMLMHRARMVLAAGYRKHLEPEITEYRNVLSDGEEIISFHRSRFSVEKRRAAGPWVPVGEGEQG